MIEALVDRVDVLRAADRALESATGAGIHDAGTYYAGIRYAGIHISGMHNVEAVIDILPLVPSRELRRIGTGLGVRTTL